MKNPDTTPNLFHLTEDDGVTPVTIVQFTVPREGGQFSSPRYRMRWNGHKPMGPTLRTVVASVEDETCSHEFLQRGCFQIQSTDAGSIPCSEDRPYFFGPLESGEERTFRLHADISPTAFAPSPLIIFSLHFTSEWAEHGRVVTSEVLIGAGEQFPTSVGGTPSLIGTPKVAIFLVRL